MGRDRFNELQGEYDGHNDTAIELGAFDARHAGYGDGAAGPAAGGQFFQMLDAVKGQMEAVDENIKQIAYWHEQALEATSESKYHQVIFDRDGLVSETDGLISEVKQGLDALAQAVNDPSTPKSQRAAQATRQQNLAKKFSEQLQRYHQMEYQYSKRNRERLGRQYRIARPDATDEEVANAIDSDQAGQVFAQSVMGSNKQQEMRRVLRDVEERQADIKKIEQTITRLAEMFVEVSEMVNRQQEVLDNIEDAVEETHGHVESAQKEVKQAIVWRIKARKK
ncbi:Plasma membrane t-SNARE, secretory vesicle fusion, partial [Coemansia helicoidea]